MRCLLLGASLILLGVNGCFGPSAAADQPSDVLSGNEALQDRRLAPPKDLNGHFPFVVPETPERWQVRREQLRRRILVSNGLWPMPEKPPLNATILPPIRRDGFLVSRVYFQSLPGHYVTGLLFSPGGLADKKVPGVLSPHGHGGRMQEHSEQKIALEIAAGAERFEGSGRRPKIARCAQLARMGCVTFIFDMIGYGDSVQIPFEVAHRHAEVRPEETASQDDRWVFFSPEADLRLQSIMGLQTWNAIRALDFLESLPNVDPDRLAVTGGSGGGTQTILLSAIDDRVKVSFPNGMVSTSMQGGCYCENCNLLRIGTGNVELAALFAPRPLGMTAADDWTRDMMTDGFPQLKELYAMVGQVDDVMCKPLLHFPHNYNYVTRATMYQWMNRHLGLGLDEPVIEEDFKPLSDADGQVWTDTNVHPGLIGIEHEKDVCQWLDEQAGQKLAAAEPIDPEALKRFREVYGQAWAIIFDQGLPQARDIEIEWRSTTRGEGHFIRKGVLSDHARGARVPVISISTTENPNDLVSVILTTREGKSEVFDGPQRFSPLVTSLLRKKVHLIIPDLFGQGELSAGVDASGGQRLVDTKKSYSAFTFGYNRTLAAERSADLCSVIAYVNSAGSRPPRLWATAGAAAWTAPAAMHAGDALAKVMIDTAGFRYADATSYRDASFVPGAVKYGDLPALLALRSPYPLMIAGEMKLPPLAQQAYRTDQDASQNAGQNAVDLRLWSSESDAVDWVTN